jgi:predicted RNA-binding Zn ribbon-like protein
VVSKIREQPPRYQRVVDGLVLPVSIAERPALDFCNTLAGWHEEAPHEYLTSYAHLAVWAREAGLVDARSTESLLAAAEEHPRAADGELDRARSLRAALYTSCTAPGAPASWEAVAAEARAAASNAVLTTDAPPGRRWSIAETTGLARPVLELAREAGDLLATTQLAHVRACAGSDCGWLFLDRSGRRRWCTMEVCGNRAKARRHAERARSGRSAATRGGA